METTGHAVVAEGLRKRYGGKEALAGFDLAVPEGIVCGLLGPNGAGKTTAVRVLTTLLRPDGGRAEVAGFDVVRQAAEARRRVGLVGQNAALDEVLSGRQNLVMFGRLYHLGLARARRRADELLERFGLADTGAKPVKQYSGGMRRRLDLAAGLIIAPSVLFLDEPTTGLDPRGRNEVWEAVASLVAAGTTVLLTTQYLEEADRLAAKICVMDAGRVIAEGSPDELKSRIGEDRVDIVLRAGDDLAGAMALAARVTGGEPEGDPDTRRVSVPVRDRVAALTDLVRALDEAGIAAEDITLRRPSLDEVFLRLTGDRAGREVAA
ncbi:daunorubicin resistance protein DrrA family ABC transporter ATP-binding protein [Sphaerisporangium siamense]|uniref:ABC-2 type transport system ATP-binding protein n=1 Tax=Sphaerisporangium siamense TaxID=795645 RepID=A0A7W7DBQ8_9ACTN|nr:ATP-binding cassette domain-containing protein [Sphaerisporangium siamense]MBB4703666.1 ABC-2 type transport system ATP-binding protein [Sphaerisporangium siamense]GII82138.1 daunorubicin resistance protein DrrA family ABC transporter ATP-binding protein [Sphaerisporangium siamense]